MAKKNIKKLEEENKSLRETCEILSDQDTIRVIKESLKQIAQGKGIPLAQL